MLFLGINIFGLRVVNEVAKLVFSEHYHCIVDKPWENPMKNLGVQFLEGQLSEGTDYMLDS
jgi:hypothetical protein